MSHAPSSSAWLSGLETVTRLAAPLFLRHELARRVHARHPLGEMVAFSARAPDKETPNEDGAALVPVGTTALVLVVADGAGGGPAGEEAARIALTRLAGALGEPGRDLREAMLNGIEAANGAILAGGSGATTTLAAVSLERDGHGLRLRPYHVGDAQVLVCGQRGRIRLATLSHAPVAYGVEAGLLDADEALIHDERHLVSNILGTRDMRIELGAPLRLAPRDTVVVASDGLFDNLHLEEVVEQVRKGPLLDAAAALVAATARRMAETAADSPGKPDDLSFILFRPDKRQ